MIADITIRNNHFAAVASDQPAFERWPPVEGEQHLHQVRLGTPHYMR